MKNFLIDLFTWRWRWNRLKFWLYPLVTLIIIIPILWTIAFISFQWYSEDAKNSKTIVDISSLSTKVLIESTMWKDIKSFELSNHKINFELLWLNENDFKNPNSWDYLIFVDWYKYQIYWKTSNSIIIKGNYIQENDSDPLSLVNIEWKTLTNWEYINQESNKSSNNSILLIISIWSVYLLLIWISIAAYIKRLHDLDKSGWWSLIMFLPLFWFWLLIYCGFFKWTPWENRFWNNPLWNTQNKVENNDSNIEL